MSFFGLSKKNREEYCLVFNLGSGNLTGSIVRFTEKPGVDVMYYEQEALPIQKELDHLKHLDNFKTALDSLVKRLNTDGLKKINKPNNKNITIKKAFYVFSSPWSLSRTKTIRLKEPRAIKITDDYLKKVIANQEKTNEEATQNNQTIEKKIIQVKINGYTVTNPHNKIAKELELSVFSTVIPQEVLNLIESVVSKYFIIKESWCHSFALASFSIIRDLFPHKEDFIQIDVGEELTDVAMVRNGLTIIQASFPLGRNHLVRELSKQLSISNELADSTLRLCGLKHTDALASVKTEKMIAPGIDKWLGRVNDVLDSFREKIYIPSTIFFLTSPDIFSLLSDKLSKLDYEVIMLNQHKIHLPAETHDFALKINLLFLDKIYKI